MHEISAINSKMRNLDFSDEGNSKLSDIRSKYNASKSKMNQKLKSLVNFLSVEEEVTGQDIQKSILDESKLHSEKLNFTLDDLKLGVFDNDSCLEKQQEKSSLEVQSMQQKLQSLQ